MEWTDEGVLLSVRKHGESSAIIDVFTENHGRHAGIVRGGGARKSAALLQPGAQLNLTWRARLEDHLGSFTAEPKFSRVTSIMAGRAEISAFGSISALISTCLPEREPQSAMYFRTLNLLEDFSITNIWLAEYTRWELALLGETGFGLDLSACAATGARTNLAFVSPKSSKAVSRSAAIGWEHKLLELPAFLIENDGNPPSIYEVLQGLALTGYFLRNGAMSAINRQDLPQARARFIKVLQSRSG